MIKMLELILNFGSKFINDMLQLFKSISWSLTEEDIFQNLFGNTSYNSDYRPLINVILLFELPRLH